MNRFEVGDKVRIREDFDKIRFKLDPGIDKAMLALKGLEDEIRWVSPNNGVYTLKTNTWAWAEEWLEEVDTLSVEEIDDSEIISMLESCHE